MNSKRLAKVFLIQFLEKFFDEFFTVSSSASHKNFLGVLGQLPNKRNLDIQIHCLLILMPRHLSRSKRI